VLRGAHDIVAYLRRNWFPLIYAGMSNKQIHSREETPLTWDVSCWMPALGVLANVKQHLLFRDLKAIVRAYREGVPIAWQRFGQEVQICPPGWAPITYGHINTIGCELVFPDDSDVGHKPIYTSLAEGIDALQTDIDFTQQGMFPFYLDLWRQIKKTFPDHTIPFTGFKAEGPLTTAWLLRGHDFFLDIYDDREAAKEYLRLVTQSVIAYNHCIANLNGQPAVSEQESHIADDGAAMIPPKLWPELVVPYLEQYFQGTTTGRRLIHSEGLVADHLKYLDELHLALFDPSVSPKLTAALVRDHCRVPFVWRLNAMQLRDMSPAQIEHWVFESVADGASSIFFHIEQITCDEKSAQKVKTFIRAAQNVEQLLNKGCPRNELRIHYTA